MSIDHQYPQPVESLVSHRLFQRGVEVHDLRHVLPKKEDYQKLDLPAFRYTAVHHTAATRFASALEQEIDSWIGHARYHTITNGWPGIAYAIGISQSGRAFILRDFDEMGFHAYNANANSFAVALDCIEPSFEAMASLDEVLTVLHEHTPELPNLARERTYGHQELSFLDARNVTSCPGKVLLAAVRDYRTLPPGAPMDNVIPVGPFSKHLGGGFRRFWETRGGIKLFGFPITEEMQEEGKTVQYFERARFEVRPDGSVQLGLVGSEAFNSRYG